MTEPSPDMKELQPRKQGAGAAIGFGTSFAVGMAICGLGGHWLDVKYGREPLFTLLGLFLGLLYGGWELWKLVTASNQQPDLEQSQQKEAGGKRDDAR